GRDEKARQAVATTEAGHSGALAGLGSTEADRDGGTETTASRPARRRHRDADPAVDDRVPPLGFGRLGDQGPDAARHRAEEGGPEHVPTGAGAWSGALVVQTADAGREDAKERARNEAHEEPAPDPWILLSEHLRLPQGRRLDPRRRQW